MSTRLQEGRTEVWWITRNQPSGLPPKSHTLSIKAQLSHSPLRRRPVNQSRNTGMSLRAERCVPSSKGEGDMWKEVPWRVCKDGKK